MTDLEAEGTEGLVQEGEEGVGCPHCRHWRDAPGPRAYCLPSMGDTEGKIARVTPYLLILQVGPKAFCFVLLL